MASVALVSAGVPARAVAGRAALLGAAVLADSALEHYRGSFRNPFMAAPLLVATALLATTTGRAAGNRRTRGMRTPLMAMLTGTVGLGFHVWNIVKRPGRITWQNLFHGAPIGAPAALILASASGAAAAALDGPTGRLGPVSVASGRALGALAAVGIAGSAATSVVDADCRSWDIPDLWVCDGSVFPTVGGANPSLTIQAIACRTADRIKNLASRGEL